MEIYLWLGNSLITCLFALHSSQRYCIEEKVAFPFTLNFCISISFICCYHHELFPEPGLLSQVMKYIPFIIYNYKQAYRYCLHAACLDELVWVSTLSTCQFQHDYLLGKALMTEQWLILNFPQTLCHAVNNIGLYIEFSSYHS